MLKWNDILHFISNGNPARDKRVEKTNDEWEKLLTETQFKITRLKETEPPGSGEYCTIFEPGIYECVCCGTALFNAEEKYGDSGDGWPSFTQPVKENAVKYLKDTSYGMVRVEIQCNTCNSHLGHVFPDGPEPSGLRYCVNSVSIKLRKKEK